MGRESRKKSERREVQWWTVTYPDGNELAVYVGDRDMAAPNYAGERPIAGYVSSMNLGPDLRVVFIMSDPKMVKEIARTLRLWGSQMREELVSEMLQGSHLGVLRGGADQD